MLEMEIKGWIPHQLRFKNREKESFVEWRTLGITRFGVNLSDKTSDGPLTNPLGTKQRRRASKREISESTIDWRDATAAAGATDA